MEVRINREIRDYTESMFFGLSLRQFFFSVLACGVAVGIYLGLNPILGTETTSWLCIVAAFPFAVLGFLKYNGMTAEKFIVSGNITGEAQGTRGIQSGNRKLRRSGRKNERKELMAIDKNTY